MPMSAVGTATIGEIAAAAHPTPPRFVHVSSFAARAASSTYAASKAAGEASHRDSYGRSCCRYRSCVRRRFMVPATGRLFAGLQMAAHGGRQRRPIRAARLSLVHVDDAAAGR